MVCSIYKTENGKIMPLEVLPYVSIVWEESWQGIGTAQLVFTRTDYVLDAVRVGRWAGITNRTINQRLMYIHSVQVTETEVWAYGYEAKALLQKCALLPLSEAGTVNVATVIESVLTNNVPYSWFDQISTVDIGTANLDGMEYTSVADFIAESAKLKSAGWSVYYNGTTSKCDFSLNIGADKTNEIVFATVLGNTRNTKYTKSDKSYCNTVIALGSDGIYESAQESPLIGETYSALLDLRDEYPREQGVTEAAYREALQSRAYMSLIARHTTEKVDIGDIDTSQFITDYDLGDIIAVDIPDLHMTTQRRVMAVKYTIEGGIVKTELTLKEV